MKLTLAELTRKAGVAVKKINAENGIKLRKVATVLGNVDSIGDAVIYRDVEWNEYRVLVFVNGEYSPGSDYHTDDKQDAESTAVFLANPKFQKA